VAELERRTLESRIAAHERREKELEARLGEVKDVDRLRKESQHWRLKAAGFERELYEKEQSFNRKVCSIHISRVDGLSFEGVFENRSFIYSCLVYGFSYLRFSFLCYCACSKALRLSSPDFCRFFIYCNLPF
jgi:hypothetical protein